MAGGVARAGAGVLFRLWADDDSLLPPELTIAGNSALAQQISLVGQAQLVILVAQQIQHVGQAQRDFDMQTIPLAIQTLFSELEQRSYDADFTEQFDHRGQFRKKKRHNKFYWYFTYRDGGKVVDKYVGPVADAQIADRVRRFSELKHDFDQRRSFVRLLASAGLPIVDHTSGEIVAALVRAGFFRLRGVLVGTTAYQCYSGVLGIRMPAATIRTQDADFAQFFAVANMIDDAIPSMIEALQSVDPSFKPVPHISGGLAATAFANKDRYKVEFLTPNRGSDHYNGRPAPMRALGGASAEPLRFLDFLIRDPIRSVMLHEAGLPVTIPAPERFAIHKLIVAGRRIQGSSKVDKDLAQCSHLIEALWHKRQADISSVWQEAWERGPAWREELTKGLDRIESSVAGKLEKAVRAGAAKRRAAAPWPRA